MRGQVAAADGRGALHHKSSSWAQQRRQGYELMARCPAPAQQTVFSVNTGRIQSSVACKGGATPGRIDGAAEAHDAVMPLASESLYGRCPFHEAPLAGASYTAISGFAHVLMHMQLACAGMQGWRHLQPTCRGVPTLRRVVLVQHRWSNQLCCRIAGQAIASPDDHDAQCAQPTHLMPRRNGRSGGAMKTARAEHCFSINSRQCPRRTSCMSTGFNTIA